MSKFKGQLTRLSPLSISIVLVFAVAMTYFLFRVFAASGAATLYITPSGTQSVVAGQNFTVSVRISSASNVPVTGASVYLTYPTGKLQLISESYGGPYNTQLVVSDSGGILRMDRAAFPMISGGDQLFAQVTFKAIATGSAPISFTGSSVVASGEDDSNIVGQKNGVTYNVTAPPSTQPSSSSGSSGSSSSGAGSSGRGSSVSGGSASSGRGSSSGQSSGSSTTTSGGSAGGSSADSGSSQSGTGQAAFGDGDIVTSDVQITVVDSQGKPVKDAEVTIGNQTVKTDKNGVAHFNDIAAGKLEVAVNYNGKKTAKTVNVKGASTQSPEMFKVSIVRDKFNPVLLFVPVIFLLAAGALVMRPWEKFVGTTTAKEGEGNEAVTSNRPPELSQTVASSKKEKPGTVYSPDKPSESDDSYLLPPKDSSGKS